MTVWKINKLGMYVKYLFLFEKIVYVQEFLCSHLLLFIVLILSYLSIIMSACQEKEVIFCTVPDILSS